MIGLAARLTFGTGREGLIRLVVTALGVAAGVALLLFAAVAFPALHAHDLRAGWLRTDVHNVQPAQDESGTDPLLWRWDTEHFENQTIVRVDVAALGPRAPVPPGLSRLPGPGELALSPALARLIAGTPRDMLADRYPGRVVETIGDAALIGPDQLMIVVGRTEARMRALPKVAEVRSIEAAPVRHGYTDFLRVMLAIGILGLIAPVVVFVATATRLAAARREQRLAALSLAGATPGQISALAATEAAVATALGIVVGFAGFVAARPYVARIPFDGNTFFPADLRLSPAVAVLIAVGVLALAVGAALLSLRRVRVSALGVARQAVRARPTWRRLVPLGAALVMFGVTLPIAVTGNGRTSSLVPMSVAFLAVVGGIVVAGPWLTVVVARTMLRLGRRPAGLMAARRLEDNPAGGFRTISGLILAVFVASVICGVLPSARAPGHKVNLPAGSVLANFGTWQRIEPLDPVEAAALIGRLRAISGVHRVVALRLPATGDDAAAVLAGCADLLATGMVHCPDPRALVTVDSHRLGTPADAVIAASTPTSPSTLDTLPLAGLITLTDGHAGTIERARTAIGATLGDRNGGIDTAGEKNDLLNHQLLQLQRLVTIALVLTLVIAGCSLAVSVAGALVERRRPYALLRLAGAGTGDLRRTVLAETSAPLLVVATISAGLGLALAAVVLREVHAAWKPPDPEYWAALAGGVLVALLLAAATALPLLGRVTSVENARFE
jgi:hypothetical protein